MIGVFDSGHGGLTVLRALVDFLPRRSFVYLGDHAHAPYGERPSGEIVDFTRTAVEALFTQGCGLVVLACNTAAAVALRTLQQQWLPYHFPDRRILGVLVPTVESVTGVSWRADPSSERAMGMPRTIAVFATRRTVESDAYAEEIRKRAPEITLAQVACEGLVHLIEQGAPREKMRAAVHGHIATLMNRLGGWRPDAVLLGCTHYPLVADLFAEALPAGTEILSQPELVAHGLIDYLRRHPEIDAIGQRRLRLFTTGDPDEAGRFATAFFGRDIRFEAAGSATQPLVAHADRTG